MKRRRPKEKKLDMSGSNKAKKGRLVIPTRGKGPNIYRRMDGKDDSYSK